MAVLSSLLTRGEGGVRASICMGVDGGLECGCHICLRVFVEVCVGRAGYVCMCVTGK